MLRTIWIASALVLCLVVTAIPALAEETAGKGAGDAALDRRMALARQMDEVQPVSDMIDSSITAAVKSQPASRRERLIDTLQRSLDYKAIKDAYIREMAETFTEQELAAMLAFYGSPEGRAIQAKMPDFQKRMAPHMTRALDAALMRARTSRDKDK